MTPAVDSEEISHDFRFENISFVVESPENQLITFTDMHTGRGHLVLTNERFEAYSQLFHQLLMLNKPSANFYTLANTKANLRDLSTAKSKKTVLDSWIVQKTVVEKPFKYAVSFWIDSMSFFKFLNSNFEVCFKDASFAQNIADFKIEGIVAKTQFQYALRVLTTDKRPLFVSVLKRFTEVEETKIHFKTLFNGFKNLSESFVSVKCALIHPAFYVIVSDFMESGSMFDLIFKAKCGKRTLTERSLQLIAKQLLEALRVPHSMGGPLMALKPENIYFTSLERILVSRTSRKRLVQISRIKEGKLPEFPEYMPPELIQCSKLLKGPQNGALPKLSLGIDFWQLGTTLYECFYGAVPFPVSLKFPETTFPFTKVEFPNDQFKELSVDGKSFLSLLLDPNWESRNQQTVDSLLGHSWFQAAQKEVLSENSLLVSADEAVAVTNRLREGMEKEPVNFGDKIEFG